MGFVFFKIPKAKKFRYRPLVWQEEKNAPGSLESRHQQDFRRDLKERWHRKDRVKRKSRGLTALIFLILLILFLLWIILT